MFRTITTTLLVYLILSIGTLNAYEPVDRNETTALMLRIACNSGEGGDENGDGYCTGFIHAASDAMEKWCVEEDVTWGQLEDLIIAELRMVDAESLVDTNGVDAVKKIISRRWPCD